MDDEWLPVADGAKAFFNEKWQEVTHYPWCGAMLKPQCFTNRVGYKGLHVRSHLDWAPRRDFMTYHVDDPRADFHSCPGTVENDSDARGERTGILEGPSR
jgi:hypothetical protein